MTTIDDTNTQPESESFRRPETHKLKPYEKMGDVAYEALALYGAVSFADADEAIKASTPLLWKVAGELIGEMDPVNATETQAFGLLLAMRAILQRPAVLELAAKRIAGHLAAFVDVNLVLSDDLTLVTVLPAVAEQLRSDYPALARETEHQALKPFVTLNHSPGVDGTVGLRYVPKVRRVGDGYELRVDGDEEGDWERVEQLVRPTEQAIVILVVRDSTIIMHASEFDEQIPPAEVDR